MESNNKKTAENARKALKMATATVIANPNLSMDDVLTIADRNFANLQK